LAAQRFRQTSDLDTFLAHRRSFGQEEAQEKNKKILI
jgi:hypothetical protein